MKTIHDGWEQFATCIKEDMPIQITSALKYAFYSGAESMFLGFADGSENADFDEIKAWIETIQVEIADFSMAVIR